jgi:hypothetical protein
MKVVLLYLHYTCHYLLLITNSSEISAATRGVSTSSQDYSSQEYEQPHDDQHFEEEGESFVDLGLVG